MNAFYAKALEGARQLEQWRECLRKIGVDDDKIAAAWAHAADLSTTTTIAPLDAYRAAYLRLLTEATFS